VIGKSTSRIWIKDNGTRPPIARSQRCKIPEEPEMLFKAGVLWLLGVPVLVIIALALFHVI
jgi:hypothetical protein